VFIAATGLGLAALIITIFYRYRSLGTPVRATRGLFEKVVVLSAMAVAVIAAVACGVTLIEAKAPANDHPGFLVTPRERDLRATRAELQEKGGVLTAAYNSRTSATNGRRSQA